MQPDPVRAHSLQERPSDQVWTFPGAFYAYCANDHATSYTYNNANQLTRIDYPDSTSEAFTYYNDGALYTRTDGKGVTTTYNRDALDRVTVADYPSPPDVAFTYDAKSRVTRMQNGADTYYRYDTYGGATKYDQLLAVERKYGSMTSYRATIFNYDQNYNRTYMRDGEGNVTTYAYDSANRMTSVTAPGSQTTTFAYDDAGNRTGKTLPNGAYATYTYSNRNWLTTLANRKSDAALISSCAYAHDYVGNRTSMTEANGDVTSYLYDDVYRLTKEEKRDSGNNLLYRYQYTYDGVGNRLTMSDGATIQYTYDSNNKLTQLVHSQAGTTTFGYDDNGNMTSMTLPDETEWEYGYDYENRLTNVTDNDEYTATYTYNADGLRLRAQESNHAYPDRWFQYDGVRPVLEGTLSGDTFTTVNRYNWEGDSYYDPLVSASIGGSNKFYLYDGLGSTRQLLDASQDVTDTYVCEAFGNLMGSSGSTPNPYRYVGSLGYYQTGSSLMHLGARYYMPELGRFVNRDALGADFHPYVYVGGSPTTYVDPEGLLRWPRWWPWQPRPPRKPNPLDPYLPPGGADPNKPIVMPPDPRDQSRQTWGECYYNCMQFWMGNLICYLHPGGQSIGATIGVAIGCAQACRQDPDSYQ